MHCGTQRNRERLPMPLLRVGVEARGASHIAESGKKPPPREWIGERWFELIVEGLKDGVDMIELFQSRQRSHS